MRELKFTQKHSKSKKYAIKKRSFLEKAKKNTDVRHARTMGRIEIVSTEEDRVYASKRDWQCPDIAFAPIDKHHVISNSKICWSFFFSSSTSPTSPSWRNTSCFSPKLGTAGCQLGKGNIDSERENVRIYGDMRI